MITAPKGWKTKPLGQLLDVQNGYAFASELFSKVSGKPLIRIRDLKNGHQTEIGFQGAYDDKFMVHAGDLLIGMDGEFRCYQWKGIEALLNQRVCRLVDFTNEIMPEFVLFGVNSHLKVIEEDTPFVTVRHLSAKKIKAINFAYPPLDEQRRIVARIKECMERVGEIERLRLGQKNDMESFQDAILDSLVKDTWPSRRLKDLTVDIRNGWSGKQNKKYPEVGVLRLSCVHSKHIDTDDIKPCAISPEITKTYELYQDDVFVVRGNGSPHLVGRSAIADNDKLNVIFNDLLIRLRFSGDVRPAYINYILHTRRVRNQIIATAKTAAGIWKINQTGLKQLLIPFPDQTEQVKFVEKASRALELYRDSAQEVDISKTDKLRESILHKAFAGEL